MTVPSSMLSRVGRSVVRYYTALKINAAAATIALPYEKPADRNPVVRASRHATAQGFDRRELIERGGRTWVITMPAAAGKLDSRHPMSPN
jgi:hypothetical protein